MIVYYGSLAGELLNQALPLLLGAIALSLLSTALGLAAVNTTAALAAFVVRRR
jgi:hypothetical protein